MNEPSNTSTENSDRSDESDNVVFIQSDYFDKVQMSRVKRQKVAI